MIIWPLLLSGVSPVPTSDIRLKVLGKMSKNVCRPQQAEVLALAGTL
jgi:hypothetical protein